MLTRDIDKVSQSIIETFPDFFDRGQCEALIQYTEGEEFKFQEWPVIYDKRVVMNAENFNADFSVGYFEFLAENDDMYDLFISKLRKINDNHFHYDISAVSHIEIHKFEEGQEKPCSIDLLVTAPEHAHRKLLMYMDLNDDFEGGRLYYKRDSQRTYLEPTVGTITAIPSYQLYGVEKVTKGTCYRLAFWGCGKKFS